VSLKQQMERELNLSPHIRWGGPGRLDVLVDGTTIFSKQKTGRMPQPGEIVRLVKGRQGRADRGG
jgi:hypothetical protein